ncbi:hypothetical protein HPG69_001469 [Diceros bicornis minor]|uniref:Uncharacterized protein n=1 Tax=Diceros bicornis minor TaxID=77932 RepID=A0A7J7FFY5_DICBM|nr:hypothetical protein HPG69_001469 [Diceros bicornis minor]
MNMKWISVLLLLELSFYFSPGSDTFWTCFSLVQEFFSQYSDCIEKLCKNVVLNKKQAIGAYGELLAELLNIPLVYSLCSIPGYRTGKYSGDFHSHRPTKIHYIILVNRES